MMSLGPFQGALKACIFYQVPFAEFIPEGSVLAGLDSSKKGEKT